MTGIEPAAFRLGGEPSILLRYMDVYKIFSVGRLLQQALRRASLYPLSYRDTLYIITVIFNHYNPCIYSVFQILRCANILELNP